MKTAYLLFTACLFSSFTGFSQSGSALGNALQIIIQDSPILTGSIWDSSVVQTHCFLLENQVLSLVHTQSGNTIQTATLDFKKTEEKDISTLYPSPLNPGDDSTYAFTIHSWVFSGTDSVKLYILQRAFRTLTLELHSQYPADADAKQIKKLDGVLKTLNTHYPSAYQNYEWHFREKPTWEETDENRETYFVNQWLLKNNTLVFQTIKGNISRTYKCKLDIYEFAFPVDQLDTILLSDSNTLSILMKPSFILNNERYSIDNGNCTPNGWLTLNSMGNMALPRQSDRYALISSIPASKKAVKQLRMVN